MAVEVDQPEKRDFVVRYKPCIVVISGPTLGGKSTLANAVEARSTFQVLDGDIARASLLPEGTDPTARRDFGSEKASMLCAYRLNHDLARELLDHGVPVLLAASYSQDYYHFMLKDLQAETGVPMRAFYVEAPAEQVFDRLESRNLQDPISNVRTLEDYEFQLARFHPIQGINLVRLDIHKTVDELVGDVLSATADLQGGRV